MKILCIVDNFPPEVNALASRTYEHAIEWVKAGHQVTIVTCCPNFPVGKPFKGYTNKLYSVEYLDGIKVIRVWSYMARNQGFFKRILDFVSFSITSTLAALSIDTDVVMTSSPQFFVNFSGLALKTIKRKKWVMEVRDLWPESISAVNMMKKNLAYQFLSWLEINFYHFSDHIVVVTESFKKKMTAKGIPASKISIVFNGINNNLYFPRPKSKELANSIGLDLSKKTIGYLGTFGEAQDLVSLVDLFKSMTNYNFLFVGDGAQKDKLLELCKNASNIRIVTLVPKNETPNYYSLFDYGLVPLRESDTFKEVIPSKIFELSAMGTPIIYIGSGEGAKLVHNYHLGVVMKPSSASENLGKFEENIQETKKEDIMEFARHYSRKEMAGRLSSILISNSAK